MANNLIFEDVVATHPDACLFWPILIPAYQVLKHSSYELRDFAYLGPHLFRLSGQVRDLIIDCELGLLQSSPERRVRALQDVIKNA